MLGDEGLHLRKVNLLVEADRLGGQIRHQSGSTAGALARAMFNHLVRHVADDPAVPLVARFGATRLGLLPLLLAIRGGRFGGCPRGLLRPL
jgi:hypothetical protein